MLPKKIVIIGGAGALGKSMVNCFKTSKPSWNIMNIDYFANKEAHYNYIIRNDLNSTELKEIGNSDFISNKIDCIVNVAGGWSGGSISDDDVIEVVDKMMRMNLYSSLLACHLAKKYFKDDSLLVLTGAKIVKEQHNPGMIGYHLSKRATHHLGELLIKKEMPFSKLVRMYLPTIDTENNRKAMPDADFTKWPKTDDISKEVKLWADTKKYPKLFKHDF